jgi:hypothetical protein
MKFSTIFVVLLIICVQLLTISSKKGRKTRVSKARLEARNKIKAEKNFADKACLGGQCQPK